MTNLSPFQWPAGALEAYLCQASERQAVHQRRKDEAWQQSHLDWTPPHALAEPLTFTDGLGRLYTATARWDSCRVELLITSAGASWCATLALHELPVGWQCGTAEWSVLHFDGFEQPNKGVHPVLDWCWALAGSLPIPRNASMHWIARATWRLDASCTAG